jgi:scyllo-inositol 2-dehydrogenase (NADP+)
MPHSPIRTAVIGYGFAGRSFHSYLVSLAPGLQLHGIASRNPETREKILARGDCKAYESFEAVIADPDVDLVVIASPNSAHAPQAIAALNAGKHVVVDKPMCLSLEDADAMIAARNQSGKLLSVFHNRRWDGDFQTAQKVMNDGALGEVKWIELNWGRWGAYRSWRGQKEHGGGRFWDLGAHLLDQLLIFYKDYKPESVYLRKQYDFAEADVESEAMCILTFEGGRTGVIDTSSVMAVAKPRFYLRGLQATFQKYGVDPQEKHMIEGDIDAAQEDPAQYGIIGDGKTETPVPTQPGRWRSYYENIAAAINGEAELAVTPESVRERLVIFEGALRSEETGQVVKI